MFSRRNFIRAGAAGIGSLALRPFGLLPALAQSGPDYRALVCVFLFGGNDSNNTIIPMDDPSYSAYQSIRGNLALTGSALTPTVTSADNKPYAFHAKLTELAGLFSSKQLAVVANVGSLVQPLSKSDYLGQTAPIPSNLFSHSDQQLQWQSSIAQGHSATGWAGRAADYIATQSYNNPDFPAFISLAGNSLQGTGLETQPVAVTPGQSLQLTGFNTSAESQARWNSLNSLLQSDSGISLVQAASGVLANSIADAQALSNALAKSQGFKTVFPKTAIAAQLQEVAQIIQVQSDLQMRRQIFFCSLGGFDTHTGEIATHNNLYPQLSPALAAFNDAMQEIGMAQNVTTFTESDFSRTFQPTSGNGSDHAWGSHHLVMGGAVKGGQVYGAFPSFVLSGPDDADTRGRWIPTTSIDQYGATLCSWFGIADPQAVAMVFPNLANFKSSNLGFLGPMSPA
jgi:uncharacterized protein (DUF1501 family)